MIYEKQAGQHILLVLWHICLLFKFQFRHHQVMVGGKSEKCVFLKLNLSLDTVKPCRMYCLLSSKSF